MRLKIIFACVISIILLFAALLAHQSPIKLDKTDDLKELNSVSDLFHIY